MAQKHCQIILLSIDKATTKKFNILWVIQKILKQNNKNTSLVGTGIYIMFWCTY